jgi:hypothetical protein
MFEFVNKWMPIVMIVQYAALSVSCVCTFKTGPALYWIGATVLTFGIMLMSK